MTSRAKREPRRRARERAEQEGHGGRAHVRAPDARLPPRDVACRRARERSAESGARALPRAVPRVRGHERSQRSRAPARARVRSRVQAGVESSLRRSGGAWGFPRVRRRRSRSLSASTRAHAAQVTYPRRAASSVQRTQIPARFSAAARARWSCSLRVRCVMQRPPRNTGSGHRPWTHCPAAKRARTLARWRSIWARALSPGVSSGRAQERGGHQGDHRREPHAPGVRLGQLGGFILGDHVIAAPRLGRPGSYERAPLERARVVDIGDARARRREGRSARARGGEHEERGNGGGFA